MSLTLLGLGVLAAWSYRPSAAQRLDTPYKGELKALLPGNVGTYNKTKEGPAGLLGIGHNDGVLVRGDWGSYYEIPQQKRIRIGMSNFISEEHAKKALRKIHAQLSDPLGRTNPFTIVGQLSEKRKRGVVVGERFDADDARKAGQTRTRIFWTNGSVLFYISSVRLDSFDRQRGLTGSNREDAIKFEQDFPH